MKALITGASGQVGQALIQSAPAGMQARGFSHRELEILDARSVESALAAFRPDLIINCAAYTAVDRAEEDSDNAYQVNAVAPGLLAEAARKHSARLIHLSTDFVFDGASSRPYQPDAPTSPLSVYGRTKRDGENAVLAALPSAVVLRTAWVYASRGSNFVRTMLRLMAERKSVRVVADQIGSPTAAFSIAQVVWRIAARAEIKGIHHWTDAGVASWYDFAVAIAEEGAQRGLLPAGVEVQPITSADFNARARRPGFSVLDWRALAAQVELTPAHWRSNLRRVLEELAHG